MEYKFIKEVSNVLGFEKVLGIDFSPKKTCNFECVYCSGGKTTNWLNERKEFYSAAEIMAEINHYMANNEMVNYFLLTGSGEPSLYLKFGELVGAIKKKYNTIKIMVYSNATLLMRPDVQKEFSKCDVIGVNLNAVYDDEFKRVCQPMKEIKLISILDGLKAFKKQFKGILYVDTKFLPELNDTKRNLTGLIKYIQEIKPDKYIAILKKFHNKALTDEFSKEVKEQLHNLPFTTQIVS